MFNNYLATQKDLKTIEKGLEYVLDPKMQFVFKDKSRIINTAVVSYDCEYIYFWQINPIKLTKVPHRIKIQDKWQEDWWAGLQIPEIMNLLPDYIKKTTRFKTPIISGGLLTPFIELQKRKMVPGNPYTTEESYLATIAHEFGHIYWNSHKLWWYSNKKENLEYLQNPSKKLTPHILSPIYLSEVFAFCTEYYTSKIFLKDHWKKLDKFTKNQTRSLAILENNKDLDNENSVIEPIASPHNFAFVLGKIILNKYPKNWPVILTKPIKI